MLLCLSVGMGMGTAKAHIYEAIDDYKEFKASVLNRLDDLEETERVKTAQIRFVNDKLNDRLSGE